MVGHIDHDTGFSATLLAAVVALARAGVARRARRPVHALVAVTAAQATVGYLQYALGVPAGLVAVHVFGASLLWALAVTAWLRLHDALVGAGARALIETGPVPVLSRG